MATVHTIRGSDTVGLRLLISVPVGQDVANLGRVCQSVHVLEVLLGDLEGSSGHVGNVFSDQLAGIDGRLVDLLEEEASERLDSRAQEGGVEGHIDTLQGDGSKATLELQRLGLRLCLLGALADDLDEMGLDILDRQCLNELLDVDLLGLQVVGNASQGVQSPEVTSADVLHVGNVVVDNFQEPRSLFGNVLDNILKSLLIEGL